MFHKLQCKVILNQFSEFLFSSLVSAHQVCEFFPADYSSMDLLVITLTKKGGTVSKAVLKKMLTNNRFYHSTQYC